MPRSIYICQLKPNPSGDPVPLKILAQLSNYLQHSVLSCLPNVPEWFLWTARGRLVQWWSGLARKEGGGGPLPHRGRTVAAAAQAVLRSKPADRENIFLTCVADSVAEPDPGPFWPLDPGWVKIQDTGPVWTHRIIFPRVWKQCFGSKILKFFEVDPDPESF